MPVLPANMVAQAGISPLTGILGGAAFLLLLCAMGYVATRYRRCPPDKILVVYGTTGGENRAKCLHGGGSFVWPLIQDHAYLDLAPIAGTFEFPDLPTADGGWASATASCTAKISTDPARMMDAAERLLGLYRPHLAELIRGTAEQTLGAIIAAHAAAEIPDKLPLIRSEFRGRLSDALARLGLDTIDPKVSPLTVHSTRSPAAEALGRRSS